MSDDHFLTDDQVCTLLHISKAVLGRRLRVGPPDERFKGEARDIRTIRKIRVGRTRLWVRESVEEFIQGS